MRGDTTAAPLRRKALRTRRISARSATRPGGMAHHVAAGLTAEAGDAP